jgi:hypothetical protein
VLSIAAWIFLANKSGRDGLVRVGMAVETGDGEGCPSPNPHPARLRHKQIKNIMALFTGLLIRALWSAMMLPGIKIMKDASWGESSSRVAG